MMLELLILWIIYTFVVAFLAAWYDRQTRKVQVRPLVRRLMKREGKLKQVNIAQMNEITKIILDELGIKGIWK